MWSRILAYPAVAIGLAGDRLEPLEGAAAVGRDAVTAWAAADAGVGAEVDGHTAGIGDAAARGPVEDAAAGLAGAAGRGDMAGLKRAGAGHAQALTRRRQRRIAGAAGLRLDTAAGVAGIIPAAVGIGLAGHHRSGIAPDAGRCGGACGRMGDDSRFACRDLAGIVAAARLCRSSAGLAARRAGSQAGAARVCALSAGASEQQAQQRGARPQRLGSPSRAGPLRVHGL